VSQFFGTKDSEGRSAGGKLRLVVHKKQTKNVLAGVQIDLKIQNLKVGSLLQANPILTSQVFKMIVFLSALKFSFDDSKFLMVLQFLDAIEQLISREKGEVALHVQNAGLSKVKFQQLIPKVVVKKKVAKKDILHPRVIFRMTINSVVVELKGILKRGLPKKKTSFFIPF